MESPTGSRAELLRRSRRNRLRQPHAQDGHADDAPRPPGDTIAGPPRHTSSRRRANGATQGAPDGATPRTQKRHMGSDFSDPMVPTTPALLARDVRRQTYRRQSARAVDGSAPDRRADAGNSERVAATDASELGQLAKRSQPDHPRSLIHEHLQYRDASDWIPMCRDSPA